MTPDDVVTDDVVDGTPDDVDVIDNVVAVAMHAVELCLVQQADIRRDTDHTTKTAAVLNCCSTPRVLYS